MFNLGTRQRARATEAGQPQPANRSVVLDAWSALLCVDRNHRFFCLQIGYKIGIAAALFLLVNLSTFAAQIAILQNGFAIRHENREVRGNVTRLYLTATPNNFVELPTQEIARFEAVDTPVPPIAVPAPVSSLDAVVSAACARNEVDPDLVYSVIAAESGFNPNAVSRKGAQGLMQLMPQTAARLGVTNAFDPASNVEGGTRFLHELLAQYNNDLPKVLAAYNAGPERVEQYHGLPPYPETVTYVARIIRQLTHKKLGSPRPLSVRTVQRSERPNSKTTRPPAPPAAE